MVKPYFNSKTAKFIIISFFIALILPLWGCDEKKGATNISVETDMKIIKDEAIEALTGKKILFGHASVGNNIISGIEDIIESDERFAKLHFYELTELSQPGFYDFMVRKNRFPKEKCDHFKSTLSNQNVGNFFDIAFFKFCFVDINNNSNVQEIFEYYVETIKHIKEKFPKLTIVHVTMPLKVHSWGPKYLLINLSKGKLRMAKHIVYTFKRNLTEGDIENVKRNEFNKMLINKYKDIDPIYDLAKIESSLPNGKIVSFKHNGVDYPSLAVEYTDDGGHLNKLGRYYAAKELLITLSNISK